MIAIFFIADRVLKNIALNGKIDAPVNLIGDIFSFSFTANYYMAFSLPLGGRVLEILIFILILGLLFFLFYCTKKNKNIILLYGIIAVILGALSNFIDRLNLGYVVDYLYLKNFTIFNLADFLITSGAILIFFYISKKTDL